MGGQYFGRCKTQLCTLPISNPLSLSPVKIVEGIAELLGGERGELGPVDIVVVDPLVTQRDHLPWVQSAFRIRISRILTLRLPESGSVEFLYASYSLINGLQAVLRIRIRDPE